MNITASGSTGPTSIAQYQGFHQAVAAGVEPGVTWRPSPQFDGAVLEEDQYTTNGIHPFKGSQSPCSNFFPFEFRFKGQQYRSVEHAYQACKAWCAGDPNMARTIQAASNALRAKTLAKHIEMSGAQRQEWEQSKVGLMKELLSEKEKQCAEFRENLHDGCKYIETTTDKFWGCGIDALQYHLHRPQYYPGLNILGALITTLANKGTLATLPGNPPDRVGTIYKKY